MSALGTVVGVSALGTVVNVSALGIVVGVSALGHFTLNNMTYMLKN